MDGVEILERALATGLYPKSVETLLREMPSDFHDGDSIQHFRDVKKKVAFIFTSRSGTTFFVDALNRTARMGRIREHFNPYMVRAGQKKWGTSSMNEYVERLVREKTTRNGVFGFKGTVEALLPLVQVGEMPRRAHEWHWITIRRRDTIAQAVSLYRAKATGLWHDHGQHETAPPVPDYDFTKIFRQHKLILERQAQNERFFGLHDIRPLRLVYEDFSSDLPQALAAVFDHVGVERPGNLEAALSRSPYRPMRTSVTEDYVERFRRELGDRLVGQGPATD